MPQGWLHTLASYEPADMIDRRAAPRARQALVVEPVELLRGYYSCRRSVTKGKSSQ